jgi:phosphate transport system substrate-binding protein
MSKILFLIIAVILISCGKIENSDQPVRRSGSQPTGAGATFPYPIYSKWFSEYAKINPEAKINYQSIGSGGGVKQITEGTVDFGASDMPMSDEEMKNANDKNNNVIMNIPMVLGAVVLTYNVPGITSNINLSGEIIADIYLGKIKKWNDPAIVNLNPEVNLPDRDITVCYRTDGSGTTFVFTDYLGKVSPEWIEKVGVAKDVRFPEGQGGKGNEGVTGLVKQLEYSIGYVELIFALQNKLNYAMVQNQNGEFIGATLESVSKAADAEEMPDDMRVSITNSKGEGAYPISSYTYLLVFEEQSNQQKGIILKEFLKWAVTDGQRYAEELGYAPLPGSVVQQTLSQIEKIKT